MKYLKYFFAIFIYSFYILNVKADTFTVNGFSTDGSSIINYSNFLPQTYYGNANSYTNADFQVIYETTNITNFRTIVVQLCAHKPTYATLNNYYNNITNIDYLGTNAKCNIYSQDDGNWVFIYIDVKEWPKFIQNSNIYFTRLNLRIYGNVSWNWTARINNVFVSTENTYKQDLLTVQSGNSEQLLIDKQNSIINQNNTIINNQSNINNSINNVDNTINNDNVDSPNNSLSNLNQYLATNSTISNLITLPITLFQKVLTSLNGTCTSYDLGEYKGTHIILPCINISTYIGATLFNVIDVLISGLLIYKMSRKFIAVFHNLSSMKDGDVISD